MFMNARMKYHLKSVRRKAESGFTITIQSLYYLSLLLIFFALIYDYGNVGYAYTISSNVARLAAHDAVKNIDEQLFIEHQEIRLRPDAIDRAQSFVDTMTNGSMVVTELEISRLEARDVIILRANIVVPTTVLNSVFGIPSVSIPVEAFAEPAYGIIEEGQ